MSLFAAGKIPILGG